MENSITIDKENKTISGTFRIERGGGHIGGKMTATINISDMSPLDFSSINEMVESLAKDLIYGICIKAINQ